MGILASFTFQLSSAIKLIHRRKTISYRSFAVLGTGAVGGFYGGLLDRAEFDVHFLVRSDYEHIVQHGLQVDTPLGDFHLSQPRIYKRCEDMPQVDVVLVTWKTTANAALGPALKAVCHRNTIVLVLQNGLDVEREAAEIVGPERVLGGCCFLCSNKTGPGHIQHLDYGAIAFGEFAAPLGGQITERMEKLVESFAEARIKLLPSESLATVRWKKLVWNIPFNGLSVVLGADTAEIMSHSDSSELAQDLMLEVQQSAAANGIVIPPEHITKMLIDTKKMVPYASSMLLDYRAKRPMELEAIFGTPVRKAINSGYQPHKVEMLYQQLRMLDQKNTGGTWPGQAG